MLPLLMSETDSSDSLKSVLMFQMMSQGGALDLSSVLPILMLEDEEDSELSSTMKMLLVSSMAGAGNEESNFNMLLPYVLAECEENDVECEDEQNDLMVGCSVDFKMVKNFWSKHSCGFKNGHKFFVKKFWSI